MDKAIAILKMMATNENLTGVYHNEANQALDELTAHKAKIENLKEWCRLHHSKHSPFAKMGLDKPSGRCETLEDILQKLEELDK